MITKSDDLAELRTLLRQIVRGLWARRRPTQELLELVSGDPPLGRRHVGVLAQIGTEGERTVGELARELGLSLPAASKLTRDLEDHALVERREDPGDKPFMLHPVEFVLGSTLERVTLPDDLVARLEGKSSLGRLGLLIHSTAGFIDPGWDGHVTLELSNVANLPITIYHGMKIGQISFVQMTEPAETPYGADKLGSKYQGQRGPTPSRYWQNFEQAPVR